ncbi:solute carrier family 49 member 4 homolog [Pecten maximus]|uniref:solute carrier family 49 member 4 homolog n=1 Tax=Pecten maximus TaxID=6579 RepID=UPI001458460C|nr:solute carrier family 49 member 4 homolog [Pecten maximus]
MTSLKPEINPKNTEIEDQRTEGMSEDIQDTTLYRRRWYVLAVYCLYTFSQAGVWNTWGPIAESCKRAFGWDDTIIALLPNWGSDRVYSGGMVNLLEHGHTRTANIAAFLNALGGPVAMGAPPVLSAAWFPPNQRTTSTAIATISNYAGFAASFLIGPLFDSLAPKGQTNMSDSESVTLSSIDNHTVTLIQNTSDANNQGSQEITRIRHDVMLVMYGECGWCVLVMLLILFYFPSKPPTPPSKTASEGRIEIVSGLKQLMRSKMFLLISVIYGLPLGIVGLWGSVMSVTLEPHGVSEAQAGWIGFYSILAGCFGALFMARISDMFSKHMKQILILLFCLAFLCFLWFNLILIGIIPSSIAQIYISVITGTLWINATVPLLFEMACENTYPIAEGLTTVVLTTWLNVVGLIFLGVQMIPKIGTSWESWSILASISVCIPILCLMGDNYNRLKIDENFEKKTTPVQ